MNDMRSVIIPRSDQINADDLLAGPLTITITGVSIKPGTEQPVSISFEGDNGKPYRACKSMCRVMVHCWGPDANEYIGRSMTLYCDPKVTWGGMAVGGIRISHMSDINDTRVMALTATKGNKKPFTVKPLVISRSVAETPETKYPTLFGIKDGKAWLANLGAALQAAPDEAAVIEIGGLSSVAKTLEKAPPAVQSEVQAMLDGAMARVRAPEPEFDGGTTSEAETGADASEEQAALVGDIEIENDPQNAA